MSKQPRAPTGCGTAPNPAEAAQTHRPERRPEEPVAPSGAQQDSDAPRKRLDTVCTLYEGLQSSGYELVVEI
ncbi:hypothetical protein [Streptomyces sp. NPDC001604]|uniref:hypothetical protein n=1 Tax=Streptomyces sp. NPDC001604 TaxID=3364593 RepID=UPI00368FC8AA